MKLTVCLTASMIALLAAPGSVRAASPNGPNNPYSGLDPDGIPLAVSQGRDKLTDDQLANLQKQADDIQRSHNWLLIDYEQQVQSRNAQAPGEDKTSNVYLELSLNKDLARLAGLTPIDPNTPSPELRAAPIPGFQQGLSLRPAPTPGSGVFTPLITPLSSPAATAASRPFYLNNYAAPLPGTFAPGSEFLPNTAASPAPAPAPAPHRVSPVDTMDLQTPGMVADKEAPLPGGPDLSLDSLPDSNTEDQQAKPDANQPSQLSELKQAMNVDQMHLDLDARIKVQNPVAARAAMQAQKQPQQPNAKPQPADTDEEPTPISQQPQLSPVHAPLPSPFDIINR